MKKGRTINVANGETGIVTLKRITSPMIANQISRRGLLLGLALWLMVWGSYNTDIERLSSPDFPASALDLLHGLRSLSSLLAAYIAIIVLFTQRSLLMKLFQGPLGFLALYTLVGIASSISLSHEPLTALYWAAQYGSVLIVLWAISVVSNSPRSSFLSLINLNWIFAGILTIGLFLFFIFQPGAISSLAAGDFWGARPYESLAGIPAEMEMLGMVGTRPTGLARYAGVVAIVAFTMLLNSKKQSKFIWFFLFLIFFSILIFSQGRTAIVAFLISALLILWLQSRSKFLLILGTPFSLFLLGLTGFYQAFYIYLEEEMPSVFTLSGRTVGTWPEAWQLFLSSPLVGYGFHADRIFLEGQHTHNAFLHALVQTGLIGTVSFIFAFIWAWIILFRLLKRPLIQKSGRPYLIVIAGVLAYLTVRTITESTGAFFGTEWLILAPLLAYLTTLNKRKSSLNQTSI
ncbi:MAG: O-antigen ligase family protein [Nitrospirota bacterium]